MTDSSTPSSARPSPVWGATRAEQRVPPQGIDWRRQRDGRAIANVVALPFASPGALLASQAALRESTRSSLSRSTNTAQCQGPCAQGMERAPEMAREARALAILNLELVLESDPALDRLPGAPLLRRARLTGNGETASRAAGRSVRGRRGARHESRPALGRERTRAPGEGTGARGKPTDRRPLVSGGNAMLAPDTLRATTSSRSGRRSSTSCKDWNRNALESRGWKLGSEGFHNVLRCRATIRSPGTRARGARVRHRLGRAAQPARGDERRAARPAAAARELGRTDFFLGCVVTNHKRHEREVVPQSSSSGRRSRPARDSSSTRSATTRGRTTSSSAGSGAKGCRSRRSRTCTCSRVRRHGRSIEARSPAWS